MQRQAGHDQIEAAGGERQTLLIRGDASSLFSAAIAGDRSQLTTRRPRCAQHRRNHASSADVQCVDERPVCVVQPVKQAFRRIAQDIRHLTHRMRRPVAVPAHGRPIENQHAVHAPPCALGARGVAKASPAGSTVRPNRRTPHMNSIDARTLHDWITDGQELALLDAREDGEFGASHLFWAVPCGLARKEIRARALLPRSTRASAASMTEAASPRTSPPGWTPSAAPMSPCWMAARKAWEAAGFVLFSGVNVPSKAFGEWVEHHYGTESVDAPELKAGSIPAATWSCSTAAPPEEFNRMSIPTGISVPGGELAYRIGDIAPDPNTLVVVNCAGRTRSIMGAESLRQAGIPNKVVALRNGTMGWELAGLQCDRGRPERFQPGTPRTLRSGAATRPRLRRDSPASASSDRST